MTFVCYSLAIAVLGFAYAEPDLFLMIAMFLAAMHLLWRTR